jgi:hypothetical protein
MDIQRIRTQLDKAFDKAGPFGLGEFRQMVRNIAVGIHFKKSRYIIDNTGEHEDFFKFVWNVDYPEYLMNHLDFFLAEAFPDFPHRLYLELDRQIIISQEQFDDEANIKWVKILPIDRLFNFLNEKNLL